MKATQIRAFVVASALLAALGLGAHLASGDTVTPSGNFVASSCSGTKVTILLGTATLSCTTSSISGTVPGPSAPGTPVCVSVSTPTLSGCTFNTGGAISFATCTAAGSWNLCVTPTTAQMIGGTLNCTASVNKQTCKTISGPVTFNGTWSNSSSSASFTNQSMSVTTVSPLPCPSVTSALFSSDYCTSPAFTVTDP